MRPILIVLCLQMLTPILAQNAGNGLVSVTPAGNAGKYTGFVVQRGAEEVARVEFSSNGLVTASRLAAKPSSLRFTGLTCRPTPTLGPDSFIEIQLFPDDLYPKVSFNLNLTAFDQQAWEREVGEVPFHFLACSLSGAEVFHQRGWAIGTPVVDDYLQMKAEGPGRSVVSHWSRDWMYDPPIGAYPTAIAGLWKPAARRYIGYDFHEARLTDHSEKDIGTTYCWKHRDSEQFFCLTWPFGKAYQGLTYPEPPVKVASHLRLLWSTDMGPDDDPNAFVHGLLWQRQADLLPDVEQMNDLSWLPGDLRPTDIRPPGGLGRFTHNTGADGERWWAPNVNIIGGVGYFSPIDYYYQTKNQQALDTLASEARRVVTLGKWMDIGGDRCFFWQTPLDGGGAAMFGPGVETFHHVNGWYAGQALLDYYRNDPEGAKDLLPYVDGVLRYTKQILYTRNCYPDVPAAQFAWSATPIANFCLTYYYHFRNDPTHKELADLAYKLARSMTYRYLALWPCDNDELDDLDSSFMMEPNAGQPWLGSACANEIWVYNIAMLYEYLATGDPVMAQYLRGMLERYHELYQDQRQESLTDYRSNAFTERLGLYKDCAQGKGSRASFGGLWGGFERLIWPLGNATVRVTCGEKAAMAFNRDGRHTNLADYRYYGNGDFSFQLVAQGLQADPERDRDVTVTFPFFDLAAKRITVQRRGQAAPLPPDRLISYPAEPATVTLKGLRAGDIIAFGQYDEAVPPLACLPVKPRVLPDIEKTGAVVRGGFSMLNLARGAFGGISRDWNDAQSLAGYEPGIKTVYGVPFLLLDPELTGNKVTVQRQGIAYGEKPRYLFLLVSGLTENSRLQVYRDAKTKETVSLASAVPVVKGWPPLFGWHLDMIAIENRGLPIMSLAPVGCEIFAITGTSKPAADLAPVLAALKQKQAEVAADRALRKSLEALVPLAEPLSGKIALLPDPSGGDPRSVPQLRPLAEAGLSKHLRLLSKEDLVNPEVFNARNIRIAIYLNGEEYVQSVQAEGDADQAVRRFLSEGGTLVSLARGPFPFYYNEKNKAVCSAPRFGFPIPGGNDAWETPPAVKLTFHTNADQPVLKHLPQSFPWNGEGDQRWRPTGNTIGDEGRYLPLVTLKDDQGREYGEAASVIDYTSGELAGGRVVYVWHMLWQRREFAGDLLADVLRYLFETTKP